MKCFLLLLLIVLVALLENSLGEETKDKPEVQWCRGQLTFADGSPNETPEKNLKVPISSANLTGLVSFPGSGNTWLRYLLQQATGVMTGSTYGDSELKQNGFPAEGTRDNRVLVVKTHETDEETMKMFNKIILLIRDPQAALLAEFHRIQGRSHVGVADSMTIESSQWKKFVLKRLKEWQMDNLFWAKEFPGSVKIVHYEDLIENLEENLREILTFLDRPIDEDVLRCTLQRRDGLFKRKRNSRDENPNTWEILQLIAEKRREVLEEMGETRILSNSTFN